MFAVSMLSYLVKQVPFLELVPAQAEFGNLNKIIIFKIT